MEIWQNTYRVYSRLRARASAVRSALGDGFRLQRLERSAIPVVPACSAQEALQATEERFRATVDQAPVGIAHNSPDGRWLLVNQRLCDIYGYTREELLERRFQDVTHPDDLEEDLKLQRQLLAGEIESYSLEKRYIRKDGSEIWGNLSLSLVRGSAGEPKYTVAIVEDITARKRTEEALRESQDQIRTLIQDLHVAVMVFGPGGEILIVNQAACDMMGVSEAELRRASAFATVDVTQEDGSPVPPEDYPVSRAMATGQAVRNVVLGVFRRTHQDRIWVLVNADPERADDGTIRRVTCTFTDLTERRRAAEALRDSEERYRTLVETSPDSIILTDLDGTILMANQPTADLYGCARADELVGMNAFDLFSPEQRARARRNARTLVKRGGVRRNREYVLVRKDGSTFPAEVSTSLIVDRDGQPKALTSVVRDISERKQAEAALEHQAMHDSLTDLPNRLLLHDRLEQAILAGRREGSPLALLLMDLDRFKDINDTFGHHHGDMLLRQLGPRLRRALRESDTIARLGGDEFAVLLPGTDASGAMLSARKLLLALDRPFVIEDQTLDTRASIGIALFPDHGDDAHALLRHADVAMYVAKRDDSGYAVYSIVEDEHSPRRMALITDLREAIVGDEFILQYQPKIDLRAARVESVEALVRWQHPKRGLLTPKEFIPLAEQTGLIKQLSRWVLNEALSHHRLWQDAGLDIGIAWNLSTRAVHDPQLIDTVVRLLHIWKVAPHRLTVEITESALMVDAGRAMAAITGLHDLGVRISIDDFGTGYSSLAYLRQLPVDEVKIDKSFVMGMMDSSDDAAIVRSVLDLGHNLGLEVVAEGVENEEVLRALMSMGCERVQGFHLSCPLPAATLLRCVETVKQT